MTRDPTAEEVTAYLSARADRLPWRAGPGGIEYVAGGERHILMVVRPVDGGGEPVLLRVPRALDERQRVKARREAAALARLPAGTAPRLYWFDETGLGTAPTIVMQLVDGVDGQWSRLRDLTQDRARALGRALAQVHAVPVTPAEWPDGDLGAVLLRRIATEVDARLSTEEVLAVPAARATAGRLLRYHALVLRSLVQAVQAGVFRDGVAAFSHGDLGEGNILWRPDGSPVLVDWEEARTADAAEDIAYLFAENGLDAARRAVIRAGYEGAKEPDPSLWQRVECYLPLVVLGSAAWWLQRWARRLRVEGGGGADDLPGDAGHYESELNRRLEQVDVELDRVAREGDDRAARALVTLAR